MIKWAREGEDREAQQKGSAETVNLWWELGGPLQRCPLGKPPTSEPEVSPAPRTALPPQMHLEQFS